MDRRRQYYIDRKFQKRFLILFGSVALIIAITNFVFYKFKILKQIEKMVFKSHFVFDNLLKYFEGEFFAFSLENALLIFVIVVIVYTYFRLRIERFFKRFKRLIEDLNKGESLSLDVLSSIPDEFEGISHSINTFVETIISNRKKQEKLISQAEKILKQ